MQLKHKNGTSTPEVGLALTMATMTLLGVQSGSAEARNQPGEWDVDTAFLFYSETDDRVQAFEPVMQFTRNYEDDHKLVIKAVADVLTGASPNGATPSDQVQTFTRPSGAGDYTTTPGEQPLDDTFQDTRGALSATWSAPINHDYAYTAGVYGSAEYDYLSLGLNGSVTRYLNNKNTALNLGASMSFDSISPEGQIPFEFSTMALRQNNPSFDSDFAATREKSSDTKTVMDLLFGVTQVVNRNTLFQVNYSMSVSNGYLTDPFKILSVIDDNTGGGNYGGNIQDGNGNFVYVHEKRPESRLKHAIYVQGKTQLDNGHILDASYRLMVDDWGITSHTVDLKYRVGLGSSYLEPHVRLYQQSEADFYERYLTATQYNGGQVTLSEATADYRLGEMQSATLGLKWGYNLPNDHEISVRAEYMKQTSSGDSGIGLLASQDLYPDTDAFWLQLGYRF